MIEQTVLQTRAEKGTEAAGSSLAQSLYHFPLTIGLSGALGSGKTVFLRGFLQALGVAEPIVSPTYALEERYDTPLGEVLHIDLYRLNEADAAQMILATDDHQGIRCVEWPERAGLQADIRVEMEDRGVHERMITMTCTDVAWPEDALIDAWRKDVHLPANVGAHCDAVAAFCTEAADTFRDRGIFVRSALVRAAARVHDLFRFVDFREGASPPGTVHAPDDAAVWATWKEHYAGLSHEECAATFLREQGFPAVASVVAAHGVTPRLEERRRREEQLLFYADKRFVNERRVTVAGRFDDFAIRYGKGTRSAESLQWEQDALATEQLLFPEGAPL